jgi:hypothetical protein
MENKEKSTINIDNINLEQNIYKKDIINLFDKLKKMYNNLSIDEKLSIYKEIKTHVEK